MNLRDWQEVAFTEDAWKRIRGTLPGSLALFLDRVLYDSGRGTVPLEDNQGKPAGISVEKVLLPPTITLYERQGIRTYPPWDGKTQAEGVDGHVVDTLKTLREIEHYLVALAVKGMLR